MLPFLTTLDSPLVGGTVTTLNVTACMQDAQERIGFYQTLFDFGAVLPIIVWPLLPSTSEINNYRMLMYSSCTEFVVLFLWAACFRNDDFMPRGYQLWLPCLLPCCFWLGLIGQNAEKLEKSLQRQDFTDPLEIIRGHLATVMFMSGSYLRPLFAEYVKSDAIFFTILYTGIMAVIAVTYKPFTKLFTTILYRFTTRRIAAFGWLPQNGAQEDFGPWWSVKLRYVVLAYTLVLVYALLAATDVVGKCRI